MGDVHAGQISFPGGRMQDDESAEQGALREAYEEIGSRPDRIETLGRLTSLHIPVSNHLVFPVVGFQNSTTVWTPQETEVETIFETPLEVLRSPDAKILTSVKLSGGTVLRDVPSYMIEGQIVWGATAMILSEFTELLERIGT